MYLLQQNPNVLEQLYINRLSWRNVCKTNIIIIYMKYHRKAVHGDDASI